MVLVYIFHHFSINIYALQVCGKRRQFFFGGPHPVASSSNELFRAPDGDKGKKREGGRDARPIVKPPPSRSGSTAPPGRSLDPPPEATFSNI